MTQAIAIEPADLPDAPRKPHLSLPRIVEMNLGFLGLQFSFGLQQANMSPIYKYLGARDSQLSWLDIAGPLTGLLVQPVIGVLSDRTGGRWGRRTPYFLAGAVMCFAGLLLMPLANALMMAFSLLFLLDVGNNVTMEPYRAYVNDRLNPDQRGIGFLSQAGFTGLAQTLAYLAPAILVGLGLREDWRIGHIPAFVLVSFWFGALLSFSTIVWSIRRVPELPLAPEERAALAAMPKNPLAVFEEIFGAVAQMPAAMRTMALMSLFQWYAMKVYWNYAFPTVASNVFGAADPNTAAYGHAQIFYGKVGAAANAVAFVAAFSMPPIARKWGPARLHMLCLFIMGGGMALFALPGSTLNLGAALPFIAAIGIGIGWGSIMGNPYIVLASSIPPERTGVYMGLFNVMICAPMLLNSATMPWLFDGLLGGSAAHAMVFAGLLMGCAAVTMLWVKAPQGNPVLAAP